MLSPKQASYINLGLQDRLKCAYYCPEDKDYSDEQIDALTEFQERFFEHVIIR